MPCGCWRSSAFWTRFSRRPLLENSDQKGLDSSLDLMATSSFTRCAIRGRYDDARSLTDPPVPKPAGGREHQHAPVRIPKPAPQRAASGSVTNDAAPVREHSAAFLDALVNVVDPGIVHFNKRCTSISASPTNPARVIVHFADGTIHEADVVLGADGIRSTARDFVVGGVGKRVAFSNTVAYRGLIPGAVLKAAGFTTDVKGTPACFMGPSKVRRLAPY